MAINTATFELGIRRQKAWGGLIALALFLAGIGAGLFLVAAFVERHLAAPFNLGLIAGILLVGVGSSLAFILDLGRKDRFWRVMLRPLKSWISRGVILIMAFTVFGILYLAPELLAWLPWSKDGGLGSVFLTAAVLSAFGVIMYSGFVLSYSPSISFWNTALLPVLVAVYALMGAVGATYILQLAGGISTANLKSLELLEIWLIITSLVLVAVYLLTMHYSSTAAREAARLLLKGNLAPLFLGGVVLGGLALPLVLTLIVYSAGLDPAASSAVLVIGGLCELAGGFAFRYVLLKAGVYNPLY